MTRLGTELEDDVFFKLHPYALSQERVRACRISDNVL